MKKFTALLLSLAFCGSLLSQEYATATTASPAVLYSVLAIPAKITKLTLTATTGVATTFKIYDSTNTVTSNYVQGAYLYPVSYATNFATYWTNWAMSMSNGVWITNSIVFSNLFTGTYTGWLTNAGGTIERTPTVTVTVPANASRALDLTRFLKFGAVAWSSAAGVVEAEYYP